MSERAAMWEQLEREAREQVRSEIAADEQTPLVFGAPIAWSLCLLGRTNGVSPLHRVGQAQHGHAYTTCGELIPAPIRWLPLSPAVIRTKPRCKDCEAEMAHITKKRVA